MSDVDATTELVNHQSSNHQQIQTNPFQWIPTCIYFIIREYINSQEMLNLLNSSISIFLPIKREVKAYSLGFRNSIRYCRDEQFRSWVQSQVLSVRKQVSLDLYSDCHVNLAKYYVNGCQDGLYKLKIRGIDEPVNLRYLSCIERLCIQAFGEIRTLKNLYNIVFLEIYDCENLFSLSSLEQNCPVLKKVRISNCRKITSTKGLKHVPDVTLEYLPNLNDISSLGRQGRLELKDITNKWTDLSNISSIPILKLSNCRNFPLSLYRNDDK
jgi:hypothetical protein